MLGRRGPVCEESPDSTRCTTARSTAYPGLRLRVFFRSRVRGKAGAAADWDVGYVAPTIFNQTRCVSPNASWPSSGIWDALASLN